MDVFFGTQTIAERLLKGSTSLAAGSTLEALLLGVERKTERLFLSESWFMSSITSNQGVLRDIESAWEVALEAAGDEGRTFDD